MQKTLSIAAPTASLILFASVAASSKVTLAVLAAYGDIFLFAAPVLMPVLVRRLWRSRLPHRRVPRVLDAMVFFYPALVLMVVLAATFRPFELEGWQWSNFIAFGFEQVFGVVAIGITILGAAVISARRKIATYRKCPYCISHIPREATRCKYCTAPVEPGRRPAKITQQPFVVTTGTGTNFKRSPLNYARPGHKKDFGRLSTPRVADLDAGVRTRPLPSEVDVKRRKRS